MLKQRIVTAAVLAAIFFAALFALPARFFALVCLLVVAGAAYEWAKLSGYGSAPARLYAGLLVAAALVLWWMAPGAAGGATPDSTVIVACACAGIFWLLAAPPWIRLRWPTQQRALMAPLGAIVLLSMWLALAYLHARSPWLLLGVLMIVWLADTGAYFFGRKFGRHKLAPVVSPGKSWEGVAGGVACVAVYAVVVIASVRDLGAHGVAVFAGSVFLAAISIVGDLFESWQKRTAGVKDSGALLPGHGGLLDRIDALMPVLPLATLLVAAMS